MVPSACQLLTPGLVALDLDASGTGNAIRAVAAPLAASPAVVDFPAFSTAVLAREEICPTASTHGVAFPHARTNHVNQIVLAAGRCAAGVRFPDCPNPVHLIFVIGTPPEMVREYLALLGGLARLLKDTQVRERLMRAATAEEFIAALRPANER